MNASITKKERAERWAKCHKYMRRYSTMEEARKAMKREEGISYDTSVWISALSRMLKAGEFPGGGGETT